MTDAEENNIIQYVPFMSFVHPSFWHTLTEIKLNVDKLNETTKQVFGRFNYRDDISAIFEIDGTSFNSSPQCDKFYENVTGTIMNKNTIEEFKDMDKAALLNSVGEVVWANIKNKSWIEKPNSLLNFFILSFADLKKFNYYYWFAFPSPSQPTVYLREKTQISSQFNPCEMENIIVGHKALEPTQKCFFYVTRDIEISVKPLAKILTATDVVQSNFAEDLSRVYFGFVDPSNGENPGWPLRLFIAALLQHCPSLKGTEIKMLGLRYKLGGIDSSYIYSLKIPQDIKSSEESGWVGWERNDRGNFGPRLANMSESMDPMKIADASSDLNIKLMKWRLVPDLDITVMKDTKCLLLGSGTLGCHVARDLLAWGFRHITFLDSGKVSYSNPTRQVLFNFEDCLGGGKMKAEAAAENLKRILPTVITRGIALHIPMPGHPVGEALKAETLSNIDKLTAAIAEHDVVFLLLDSREARWLPTMIASHYGKIVINAALGFDSYLVMRHGVSGAGEGGHAREGGEAGASAQCVRGSQLGCYFCNDVTAPGNSLKDRTLDQQCTVTRPGAAAIAGALAVELLVGLLQHPLRLEAPALTNRRDDQETPEEIQGVLGAVPHSIRGFLHSYQTITPTCCKFDQCIACSDSVVNKYREEGTSFILKVCESGKYLEEVTGLRELHLAAEISDILTFSDDEDED